MDPEELSVINKGLLMKVKTHLLPWIKELQSLFSDQFSLEILEIDLFEDIRAASIPVIK